MISTSARRAVLLLTLFPLLAATAVAQSNSETEFQRGYYLQTHEKDLAGAVAAFEKVANDASASDKLRSEAKTRLAQCREDLASTDFARLMPPGALVYIEVNQPGSHVAHLAKMLGLVHENGLAPGDLEPGATPLGDGLFLPDDFTISPALISELKKFRGAAIAVTSINEEGPSDGLIVLHPGDSDLMRGLIETSIQVLEPVEPIEGFKTYLGPEDLWIAITARLFLASSSRDEIVAAIARLNDPEVPSLANQSALDSFAEDRKGSLVFVYVDGQQLIEQLEPQMTGRDAAVARSLLDLDHFESFAAGVRTSDEGVHLHASLRLKEGHHNLAYGLIRTAPVTGRALEQVPEGAAVVALLGLNPHGSAGPEQADDAAAFEYLTGMDLGREIFANIEEVAFFVLPGDATSGPFPNVGAVFTVKDPAKSEALWNQLLSIPAMVDADSAKTPQEITLAGRVGREYQLPNIPPLVIVRAGEGAILAGTKGAVTAAAEQKAIAGDESFRGLLDRITPNSSKAVLVHVGRVLAIAHGMAKGQKAEELGKLKTLLSDLTVSVVTDEQPTQFSVHVDATGLPNLPSIVKAVAGSTTSRNHSGKNRVESAEVQEK